VEVRGHVMINKEDALVLSTQRRLISGTEGDSDDSGGQCRQSFSDTSSPRMSWKNGHKQLLKYMKI